MSPTNGSGITSKTIPARVCCPKGPTWCKGSIPTYKLVFDKSEGRTPECECCGRDYRIPPNIPKDPKKVPRPTRAKTPSRTPTRSPTPKNHQVRFDKKDEEIKKLRLQLKQKQQKDTDPTCEEPQQNEDHVLLKELKNNFGSFKKAGLDTKELQAKIDALEIKCAKKVPQATSEALKRKLLNAENKAQQLARNVQKTNELLESQSNALVDAEEDVQRLQEEHKQALKKEGYEQAAIPADLLVVPAHLEGKHREQYLLKLEELQGIQNRYQQEAAAITGNLQAFNSPPQKEPEKDAKNTEAPDEKMDDQANKENTGPLQSTLTKEESDAVNKAKNEKRTEAHRAARARVESLDANKKAKIVDAAEIRIDDE